MQSDPHADARARMVEQQIAARGVKDLRVLAAMRKVPRHRFVHATQAGNAYDDRPLPIGHGQTISQPYIVAYMTELLRLQPGAECSKSARDAATRPPCSPRSRDRSTASRSSSRWPRALARRWPPWVMPTSRSGTATATAAGQTRRRLTASSSTAAPDHVPPALVAQLAVGARLVIPVGDIDQEIRVITKTASGQREERLIPVRFVPLTRDVREQD